VAPCLRGSRWLVLAGVVGVVADIARGAPFAKRLEPGE
jgi:hypothetical protein